MEQKSRRRGAGGDRQVGRMGRRRGRFSNSSRGILPCAPRFLSSSSHPAAFSADSCHVLLSSQPQTCRFACSFGRKEAMLPLTAMTHASRTALVKEKGEGQERR
eukprot:752250-Hanusia_phi.AAC.2